MDLTLTIVGPAFTDPACFVDIWSTSMISGGLANYRATADAEYKTNREPQIRDTF